MGPFTISDGQRWKQQTRSCLVVRTRPLLSRSPQLSLLSSSGPPGGQEVRLCRPLLRALHRAAPCGCPVTGRRPCPGPGADGALREARRWLPLLLVTVLKPWASSLRNRSPQRHGSPVRPTEPVRVLAELLISRRMARPSLTMSSRSGGGQKTRTVPLVALRPACCSPQAPV